MCVVKRTPVGGSAAEGQSPSVDGLPLRARESTMRGMNMPRFSTLLLATIALWTLSKYPPAEPGALWGEPLKGAVRACAA
jgi:hypothetical protein